MKLTPKAEELLARLEAREAEAKKKAKEQGAEEPQKQEPAPIGGLGPNPLDFVR